MGVSPSRTMVVEETISQERKTPMSDFIARYQDQLSGTLSGFDRLVFRGTLWRNRLTGLKGYLWAHQLGARDFGEHAEQISKRVKSNHQQAPPDCSLSENLRKGRRI